MNEYLENLENLIFMYESSGNIQSNSIKHKNLQQNTYP